MRESCPCGSVRGARGNAGPYRDNTATIRMAIGGRDEMPDWAGDKAKRLAKIQEAMAALEADAKLAAEEERRIEAEKEKQRHSEGRKSRANRRPRHRTNLIPRRSATSPIRKAAS